MCLNKPVAEILMATYNGEKYLGEQIESILAQSDTRWHLTISDDGSTDGTAKIIDEYAARYPERIVRYRSGIRFGNARDHFFHLMKVCDAPYMFFCDQDDVWYPQKIQVMMDEMLRAEAAHGKDMPVLVFSDQTPTDEQLRPLAQSLMRYQQQYAEVIDYRAILMQNIVTGGAMVINKALAQLAGLCSDTANVIMHDWWIAVVAARFGKVIYLDEALSAYRQHGDNSVGAKNVSSLAHIVDRMLHLGRLRNAIDAKKRQAAVFSKTYEQYLNREDRLFLQQFIRSRSGMMFYWKNRVHVHDTFHLLGMIILG